MSPAASRAEELERTAQPGGDVVTRGELLRSQSRPVLEPDMWGVRLGSGMARGLRETPRFRQLFKDLSSGR